MVIKCATTKKIAMLDSQMTALRGYIVIVFRLSITVCLPKADIFPETQNIDKLLFAEPNGPGEEF